MCFFLHNWKILEDFLFIVKCECGKILKGKKKKDWSNIL